MGRRRSAINRAPVDRFTAAHGALGAAAAIFDVPLPAVMVLAIGWELAEKPLKRRFPGRFPNPTPDTAKNAAWDISATVMGYAAARSLENPRRRR
jgi:hypothetical protein